MRSRQPVTHGPEREYRKREGGEGEEHRRPVGKAARAQRKATRGEHQANTTDSGNGCDALPGWMLKREQP